MWKCECGNYIEDNFEGCSICGKQAPCFKVTLKDTTVYYQKEARLKEVCEELNTIYNEQVIPLKETYRQQLHKIEHSYERGAISREEYDNKRTWFKHRGLY